ncbi:hypothetical protein B7R21_01940 [Subtercola boreus]|uniref:DUF5666 domain-containing protein n=1 Tax=Subtercola boreus TaxID=120213 RepID=A0A3E0W3T1_9MICO|nr:hypothetical protein [Subtercola boreus]RFA16173.1 hypothetical protein B7R21_01940 [Subtercola boreus]
MAPTPTRRTIGRAAIVAAAVLASSLAFASPAQAKTSSNGGDFAVTVAGTTYNPAPGRDVRLKDLKPGATVAVRGINVGFDIRVADLGVYNYTLTGAPDAQRMVTKPTTIFASKVPTLTPAQLAGATIKELQVQDDTLVVTFTTAAGKYKIQAKDGAQGGIFQMETEFAAPVEFVHTLAPGIFYFTNTFTGKVNFGDGIDAVASGPNAHQMLLGKDSPQVATKTLQTGTVTKWLVQPGGRLGGVLGEDAIELSAGATNCTSQCQAQNQIHGSLPVPSNPTNPTPIGG